MTQTPYRSNIPRREYERSQLIPAPPAKAIPSLPPGGDGENGRIPVVEEHFHPSHQNSSYINNNYPITSTQKKVFAEELNSLMSGINEMAEKMQDLLQKQEQVAEQSQILNEITSHIRQNLSLEVIFSTVVQDIREILQVDRAVVYRFEPNWDGIIIAESVGTGWTAALGANLSDPCFRDRYIEPYQKGRVRAINNIYEAGLAECHIKQLEKFEVQANLVAPILANDKLFGLLIAHQCAETKNWQEWEIEILKQLGIQVGYAIDQAILVEKKAETARLAQALNNITFHIREYLNADDIFNATVEDVRDVLQTDRAIVYLFDANWNGTVVAESVGSGWPTALGKKIPDPCFKDRYVKPYQRGRVKATANIYEAGLTECHIGQLKPFEVKANLVAPILFNQKLYGLLIVHQCGSTRNWQEEEIEFFKQVATQVGFALDQAIILQKQQAAAQRSQLLNEITSRIRASLNQEDIFTVAVEDLRQALEADRVIVYRFGENWLGTVVAESVTRGWAKTLNTSIDDPCFREGYIKPYLKGRVNAIANIREAGLTECYISQLESFGVKANLVAPIVANQKLYGLLIAHQCDKPRNWEESDIDFFKQVATQVGFALDQAIVLELQQAATKRAQLLNEITSKIRESLKTEDVFTAAVEETQAALQVDRVVLCKLDEQWRGLIIAESVNLGYKSCLGLRIDGHACLHERTAKQYQKGKVTAIVNIHESEMIKCHVGELEIYHVKAQLIAPILVNQQLYGLLIAQQCDAPRKWKDTESDFFKQIATQVGFAIDQAILLEKQQAAVKQAQLLNEITARIRESLKTERIFNVAVEETRKAMKADRVVVYRFGPNWEGNITAEALNPGGLSILGGTDVPCFPPDYVEPYEKGRVQVFSDVTKANLSDCHLQQLMDWKVKANVVAPILANQKLFGLLGVHQCSSIRDWQEWEIQLFKQVAIQMGYALDQAFVLEQLEQARTTAEAVATQQRQQKETLQKQIEKFLEDIEGSFSGDLTVRAKVSEGEMGTVADFFNATIENLQQIVIQVQAAATEAAKTAQGSETDVKILSTDAQRQAESITSALTQVQEMVNSIQGVANNAAQARQKVQQANQTIQAGDEVMNRTVAGIVAIQQTVEEASMKVKHLGEASQKISRVVSLISDFANQTNVLALNASVKATRAGEEDQGFALVAEEVRTLAEQSAAATKEIEQIVEEIQTETNEVVNAMEAGMEQVLSGTHLVEETRAKLNSISAVSAQIRTLVEAMAKSAQAQVQTSASVSQNMQEVASIANRTSEQSTDVADSFTKLLRVAQQLQESVAQFRVK